MAIVNNSSARFMFGVVKMRDSKTMLETTFRLALPLAGQAGVCTRMLLSREGAEHVRHKLIATPFVIH